VYAVVATPKILEAKPEVIDVPKAAINQLNYVPDVILIDPKELKTITGIIRIDNHTIDGVCDFNIEYEGYKGSSWVKEITINGRGITPSIGDILIQKLINCDMCNFEFKHNWNNYFTHLEWEGHMTRFNYDTLMGNFNMAVNLSGALVRL
jgi:hypothetical protein